MSETETPPPYPNNLRTVREAKLLTRGSLRALCGTLAEAEPNVYTTIGLSAIRDLEAGLTKPKLRTLATIAKALATSATELFPLGPDDPVRNPKGRPKK